MEKLASIRPVRWLVMGMLCLLLLGCGMINPKPPRAVVESAIAQRLAQTQTIFDGKTLRSAETTQVGGVHISHRDRVQVDNQWALQVTGTYRLRASDLSRVQRRQVRPFEIYLQRDEAQNHWFLLAPDLDEANTSSQWRTVLLVQDT